MPPKGKAAAKAKAKGSKGAADKGGKDGEDEKPPPPPCPMLVRFPDDGAVDAKDAPAPAARCVQLAWHDRAQAYKLQSRLYLGGGEEDGAENPWADVEHVEPRPAHGRADVHLATGLHHARAEFRLAFRQPGVGMTNWCSAPTDPVATVVDPPTRPAAEVAVRGDYCSLAVRLRFTSTDDGTALAAKREAEAAGAGPWAAYPALGLCRAQVRWRVLRRAASDQEPTGAASAMRGPLPPAASAGHKETGPVVELGRSTCPFDPASGSWAVLLEGVPHGLVVCAEVRVGTALRWSAWSEESEELETTVPPPLPMGPVEVVSCTDSSAKVRWQPFQLAGSLSLCEYRVTICHLDDGPQTVDPDWRGPGAQIGGIFTAASGPGHVEYEARMLMADMFYAVRVDARYPFVGERGWAETPSVTEAPIHTVLGDRPPPLAPVPIATDEVEAILLAGQGRGGALATAPFPDSAAWLALLVDSAAAAEYRVEWAPTALRAPPGEVEGEEQDGQSGGAGGGRSAEQGRERVPFRPVAQQRVIGTMSPAGRGWTALAVLLHPDEEPLTDGPVVCRLRHKAASTVAPHMGTGSTSAPVAAQLAAPAHCLAQVRYCPRRRSHGMMVRLFLGSALAEGGAQGGGVSLDALSVAAEIRKAAGAAPESGGTSRHLAGHAFVGRAQVRVRPQTSGWDAGEAEPSLGWVLLPPRALPPACPSATRPGPAPPAGEGALSAAAALALDAGDRHELWLWPEDGLAAGTTYEVQVRVGTSSRWSPWADAACPAVTFATSAPMMVATPTAHFLCETPGPTLASLRFPPFQLAAGATSAEVTVTATPRFHAQEQEEATGLAIESAPAAAGEAAVPVVTVVNTEQRAFPFDEELIERIATPELFEEIAGLTPAQASQKVDKRLKQERDHELGLLFEGYEGSPIRLDVPGLLPATSYEFSVVARYPESAGVAPPSEPLVEVAQTPCGLGPPLAPIVLEVPLAGAGAVGPWSRTALLEIEDRPGYCLQRVDVPSSCWYEGRKRAGASGGEDSHGWWSDALIQERSVVLAGEWAAVPTRPLLDRPGSAGRVCVVAELPGFDRGDQGGQSNQELPDVVCFRLGTADRGSCHPCRWIGVPSEPVATCIAPVAAEPAPRPALQDRAWRVDVFFLAHTASRPPGDVTVEQSRAQLAAWWSTGFSELPPEPPSGEALTAMPDDEPDDEPPREEAAFVPAGYGHRAVRWAQARVRERGAGRGAWQELEQVAIADCRASSDAGSKASSLGDLHALQLSGADPTLGEGKVYQVQVRIGDGFRWSDWSSSSRPFRHEAPPPERPGGQLEVATLSASAARLRWPAFAVPKGITEVEYRLLAIPVAAAVGAQGAHAVETLQTLPAGARGEPLEAQLLGLLPSTAYVLSVSARYPCVGYRSWCDPLTCGPLALDDAQADWPAPPPPAMFPGGGPSPLALAPEGVPFFCGGERALLVGFPDTARAPDGIRYALEYRHVGLAAEEDRTAPSGGEGPSSWMRPLEVLPADVSDRHCEEALGAAVAPWKVPPALWRVRLPGLRRGGAGGSAAEEEEALWHAHAQRVQFRLAAEARGECPVTRWFSGASAPACAAMAPPLAPRSALLVAERELGVAASFCLCLRLAPGRLPSAGPPTLGGAAEAGGAPPALGGAAVAGAACEDAEAHGWLPEGFGHAFATRFQLRSRHSPRPPGPPSADGRRPMGLPWSAWACSPDAPLAAAQGEDAPAEGEHWVRHSSRLPLPPGELLDYGSWYQVSVRVSDGLAWSDWSVPSAPVKVYVAPPKPEQPDTDKLSVEKVGGGTVRLRWPPLRGCGGLKAIEYGLFKSEALKDGSAMGERRLAALFRGHTPAGGQGGADVTSHVLTDLRQDTTYVFTLAARYTHVGPREFEDVFSSPRTSLRAATAPLPVPAQVPLPFERMRRLQCGARCVLMRWSFAGLRPDEAAAAGQTAAGSAEPDVPGGRYDLQALPEGVGEDGWLPCKDVSRVAVDGAAAWLLRDVPGRALRTRFRLYERESGRIGRASPLMLSHLEPVATVSARRVVDESSSRIVLRAPLDGALGTHEFVCRYQVRYQAAHVDAPWVEMPIQVLWHRQNDHLADPDPLADRAGALVTGLEGRPSAQAAGDGGAEDPPPADGGGLGAIEQDVSLPPAHPTIPLATVSPTGHVTRQRCLVACVREEDGLKLDTRYAFSVRVGDLFHMTEWSEPSEEERLSVPPPHISPLVPTQEQAIAVSDLTESSLRASWPQFVPAAFAGVPVHAEVEYRLTVTPQPMSSDRLAQRSAGAPPAPAPPPPRSEHLLCSAFPRGTPPDEIVQGRCPSVVVSGLSPRCQYSLALQVRYARLGSRGWARALCTVATTKKAAAQHAAEGSLASVDAVPAPSPRRPPNAAAPRMITAAASSQAGAWPAASAGEHSRPGTPSRADSPRALLPPLGARGAAAASESPPPGSGDRLASAEGTSWASGAGAPEWRSAADADLDRVIGGTRRGLGVAAGTPAGEADAGELPLPLDSGPFWTRDPSAPAGVAGRPAMPRMPAAAHPQAQLGLIGRGAGQLSPRPPAEAPPGRSAYPRRARQGSTAP